MSSTFWRIEMINIQELVGSGQIAVHMFPRELTEDELEAFQEYCDFEGIFYDTIILTTGVLVNKPNQNVMTYDTMIKYFNKATVSHVDDDSDE